MITPLLTAGLCALIVLAWLLAKRLSRRVSAERAVSRRLASAPRCTALGWRRREA